MPPPPTRMIARMDFCSEVSRSVMAKPPQKPDDCEADDYFEHPQALDLSSATSAIFSAISADMCG